ncbi:MAG: hypothetical protein IH861_12575 [Chloroflexi bacterium]|nr:hypothetical protein [Chloroflexota bacterium]
MSRFVQWFVSEHLQRMGWPRTKGFFRKTLYVDARVVNAAFNSAMHICVSLGAGRPELALKVFTDTFEGYPFEGNPWTEDSVTKLLEGLQRGLQESIDKLPDTFPWVAISRPVEVIFYASEVKWQQLGDNDVQATWGWTSAMAILWGLIHDTELQEVFENQKADYERAASAAIPAGLDISARLPWATLEDLYQQCEGLIQDFESAHRPLPDPPAMLRAVPEIARRL